MSNSRYTYRVTIPGVFSNGAADYEAAMLQAEFRSQKSSVPIQVVKVHETTAKSATVAMFDQGRQVYPL
jgi:hypothetical protein